MKIYIAFSLIWLAIGLTGWWQGSPAVHAIGIISSQLWVVGMMTINRMAR